MTNLNFEIITNLNSDIILFADYSEYDGVPVAPTLYLKFPKLNKRYKTSISFGEFNFIDSVKLSYSSSRIKLPDGLYEAEYKVGNDILKTKFYRITNALIKLDKLLKNTTIDGFNKELLNKYNKINLYLHGAKSAACVNADQANSLYNQADNLLSCNDLDSDKDVWMFEKCTSCL